MGRLGAALWPGKTEKTSGMRSDRWTPRPPSTSEWPARRRRRLQAKECVQRVQSGGGGHRWRLHRLRRATSNGGKWLALSSDPVWASEEMPRPFEGLPNRLIADPYSESPHSRTRMEIRSIAADCIDALLVRKQATSRRLSAETRTRCVQELRRRLRVDRSGCRRSCWTSPERPGRPRRTSTAFSTRSAPAMTTRMRCANPVLDGSQGVTQSRVHGSPVRASPITLPGETAPRCARGATRARDLRHESQLGPRLPLYRPAPPTLAGGSETAIGRAIPRGRTAEPPPQQLTIHR